MEVINGEWIMSGIDWDAKGCIHSAEELLKVIDKIGFLPLFSNKVPGFSVENMTDPGCWWCGRPEVDPWEWRVALSRTGKVAYGKFFGNKAGFVSKKWFPDFANYRRDGYDFDARYDDGKAERREKMIMDLFIPADGEFENLGDVKKSELEKHGCAEVLFTNDIRNKAGFGTNGEHGFEATLAKLQMMAYLVTRDFQMRVNKKGETFGWAIAQMTPPEYLWGYDFVTSRYTDKPKESFDKIVKQVKKHFDAPESEIRKVLK